MKKKVFFFFKLSSLQACSEKLDEEGREMHISSDKALLGK